MEREHPRVERRRVVDGGRGGGAGGGVRVAFLPGPPLPHLHLFVNAFLLSRSVSFYLIFSLNVTIHTIKLQFFRETLQVNPCSNLWKTYKKLI